MPHGDGGRALKKAEKRIKELQEKMKTAPAKEKKRIQKTKRKVKLIGINNQSIKTYGT